MEKSQKILQEIKQLKDAVARFMKLSGDHEDLETLVELAIDEEDESLLPEIEEGVKALTEELETMKLETLLSGKFSSRILLR